MTPPPKCLYETLNVPQTATESEIKKAYKALALQSHPDKNRNDPEAVETFKQIQHAYTVLSDPHERAWYDSHRGEILHGREPGSSDASAVSEVDLFAFFSTSVYQGYEGEQGFYEVFGGVFDRLWREELERGPAPVFGSTKTEWADVRAFYQEWDAFSSTRSFGIADKWNLAEAPNREVRRAMEKENKRERARVKKEFNSTVRELVAFVKKRDPRVVKRRKEEEELRIQEEEARKEREVLRKRERAEENERVREEREKALEEDAEGLDEILAGIELDERIERRRQRKGEEGEEGEEGSDDGEVDDGESYEELELYCAACKKPFRSAAQRADHERSKKHRAAVAKLRKELLAEEAALGNVQDAEGVVEDKDFDEELPLRQSRSKKKRKKKVLQTWPSYVDDAEDDEKKSSESADEKGEDVNDEQKADMKDVEEVKEEGKQLSKREKRKLREARRKANGEVEGYRCNTCGNPFQSRNKLMRHVESTGHALAL